VLRDIAGHCVEETGGLFVKRPEDSEEYFQEKLEGCRACDIPVEMIDGEEARRREPYLARDVEKAIALPDAAVDPSVSASPTRPTPASTAPGSRLTRR